VGTLAQELFMQALAFLVHAGSGTVAVAELAYPGELI